MSNPLSPDKIMQHFQESWRKLPDYRQPNNNTKYEIVDAALAAYSVFFMQSPSFLAHQRDMQQRKGKDNAATLFGMSKIPSDNQIRNLLDPVTPDYFHADFIWMHQELEQGGSLAAFQAYKSTYLIPFDALLSAN